MAANLKIIRLFRPVAIINVLLVFGCTQQGPQKVKDTPTAGSIAIAADYEYEPITSAEISVFEALYVKAKIHPIFTTEDSAFALLLKDSVRLIVASRKLLAKEEDYFHTLKFYPEQMKVATDGLALVVNKDNPDTLLTLYRLKAIFSGKDSLWWHQGKANDEKNKISAVFDYENSGNSRYIMQHLASGNKLPAYCYAMHGNNQVLDYVSKNKNALGIIGVNWISDGYDTTTMRYMKNVTVVAVSKKDNPAGIGDYYKPTQENLQYSVYPLCRDVYIISREAYTGLGSGFFSFVTSNRGQRIIFRDGLGPITALSHALRF